MSQCPRYVEVYVKWFNIILKTDELLNTQYSSLFHSIPITEIFDFIHGNLSFTTN